MSESWAPEQTKAQKASRYQPSTLKQCGHGLNVAGMVGADTCDAADRYIRELEQKVAAIESMWNLGAANTAKRWRLVLINAENGWFAAQEASES